MTTCLPTHTCVPTKRLTDSGLVLLDTLSICGMHLPFPLAGSGRGTNTHTDLAVRLLQTVHQIKVLHVRVRWRFRTPGDDSLHSARGGSFRLRQRHNVARCVSERPTR